MEGEGIEGRHERREDVTHSSFKLNVHMRIRLTYLSPGPDEYIEQRPTCGAQKWLWALARWPKFCVPSAATHKPKRLLQVIITFYTVSPFCLGLVYSFRFPRNSESLFSSPK